MAREMDAKDPCIGGELERSGEEERFNSVTMGCISVTLQRMVVSILKQPSSSCPKWSERSGVPRRYILIQVISHHLTPQGSSTDPQ